MRLLSTTWLLCGLLLGIAGCGVEALIAPVQDREIIFTFRSSMLLVMIVAFYRLDLRFMRDRYPGLVDAAIDRTGQCVSVPSLVRQATYYYTVQIVTFPFAVSVVGLLSVLSTRWGHSAFISLAWVAYFVANAVFAGYARRCLKLGRWSIVDKGPEAELARELDKVQEALPQGA